MEGDRKEFRDRIFGIADRIALERGTAAVSVTSVSEVATGGRQRITQAVKAWKTRQEALAADMPDHLRVMAKRIAEEAWLLALIAQGDARERRRGPEADLAAPPDMAPIVETVRPGKPSSKPKTAAAHRSSKIGLKPIVWSGASAPAFAKSVAISLREAGYPLLPRELEAIEFPPSRLPGYDAGKPGRAISRALAGSRIQASGGAWWFADVARPTRPKRERATYQRTDTPLAKRRQLSPVLIQKAVKFIATQAQAIHFGEIWQYINAPPDFSEAWLRHALRDLAKSDGAKIAMLGDGRYASSAVSTKRKK